MPEKNNKEAKIIHVDKLIIKADEVVIHQDRPTPQPTPKPERRPEARDFWGFPVREPRNPRPTSPAADSRDRT
ncbi:MAG: hypothetical protein LKI80_03180 [Sporolactobacillus sp.]|jgi:hypothetical protein|nr:hypothetical protein [Sporolactobacillus sp.]